MGSGTRLRRAVRPVAFIAAYVLAARATEGLTTDNGFTAWYPPAGMVLAYLVLVGPGGAGTVFAARLINTAIVVPEAWRDEADGVIVRAIAITAVYAAGAVVLRRVDVREIRLQALGWFALVGVVAVPLGAALAVAAVSVVLLGETGDAAFSQARTVWIGDAVSIATIVPAVVTVVTSLLRGLPLVRRRTGRGAGAVLAVQLVSLVVVPVVALWLSEHYEASIFLFLAVAPVVWVAMQGDIALAAVGLFVVNLMITVAAAAWVEDTRMSELQVVMLGAALIAMYVASATFSLSQAVRRLGANERRYLAVVDNAPNLIVHFDVSGEIRFANRPAWLGQADDAGAVVAPLRARWEAIVGRLEADDSIVEESWESTRADGDARWLVARLGRERAAGGLAGVVAIVADVTPRRHAELELERARWQDPLTGLANRQRFLDLLTLLGTLPEARHTGVAMIDIDGFKGLNETLGHEGADQVLVEVARRLQEVVGGDGILARLAADEFAVALPVAGAEDAVAFGELLVRHLRLRVPHDDRQVLVTCSVGVASDVAGRPATSVFYDAESALHAAKEGGRDRCATFEAGLRLATVEREARLSLIRHAIEEGIVVVHYQPVVDLDTRAMRSVEALVRLPDSAGGLLLPGSFIDLVEEAGLDLALGSLVLEQALSDLAAWDAHHGTSLQHVAVNVTARQLTSPGFVHEVAGACRRHGIDPHRLRLELTETMVMADLDAAVLALEALRGLGVSAALDDFGIGYSSMAYLQRFPVDVLKVDRSFVAGLPDDDDDRSIVGLVVGLARALGKEVSAEGIETDEQRRCLLTLGCTRGQGFFFARPVDADEIALRLARHPQVAPT